MITRGWSAPTANRPAGTAGFTLIEMMIVLAVMGLLVAAVPAVLTRNTGQQLRITAASLASDLRLLREEARRGRTMTTLVIAKNAYLLEPADRTQALPSEMSITMTPTEPMLVEAQVDRVGFYPDGSSTGGMVALRAGTQVRTVLVRWLDGAVLVHD